MSKMQKVKRVDSQGRIYFYYIKNEYGNENADLPIGGKTMDRLARGRRDAHQQVGDEDDGKSDEGECNANL
jgi:hypothetical protein